MDLGRDLSMAYDFYAHGAITEEQWNLHRLQTTLKMACGTRFHTNGKPDAKKMLEYWNPEWADKLMDPNLMIAFDQEPLKEWYIKGLKEVA